MSIVKPLWREPDPAVVEKLEEALAEAKAGKIVGIVIMSTEQGGTVTTREAGWWAASDALWCFERWKHKLLFGGGS